MASPKTIPFLVCTLAAVTALAAVAHKADDSAPPSELLSRAEKYAESGGNWEAANALLLRVVDHPAAPADTAVTSRALALLEESGNESGVEPILELAARSGPQLRQRAAQALARMKGRSTARELAHRFALLPPDLQGELSATLAQRSDMASLPPLPEGATTASLPSAGMPPLRFQREKISARSFEAAAVADLNLDGSPDLISGGFWYPGPDFRTSHKICDVKPSGEYFDDFSDYPMDINGDGYPDIVTGGFFGGPLRWRENPRGKPVEWKEHPIAHVGSIETTRFWDVDGDGFAEICPNAGGNIFVFRLKRDARGRGTAQFDKHVVRTGGVGHGLGFGDLNGDGRGDFVGPDGWYESPEQPLSGSEWTFHREFQLGSASVPIVVRDVSGDGQNDLIVGQGHSYGLDWLEQATDSDGNRHWVRHPIEADRSQFHELFEADLDNDGTSEVITGKRWRAHNGNDPGAEDPVGLYVYWPENGRFRRMTVNYGSADRNSGTGIYLWAEDVDGNGWKDILAAGKEGLYLFRNFGPLREPDRVNPGS